MKYKFNNYAFQITYYCCLNNQPRYYLKKRNKKKKQKMGWVIEHGAL